MPEFVLDTEGYVERHDGARLHWYDDLTPFVQGYIGAMMASVRGFHEPYYLKWDERTGYRGVRFLAFRDLAPETLARIIEDCDGVSGGRAFDGECFWRQRQAERWDAFPPLKPYLGDDGKVYLS